MVVKHAAGRDYPRSYAELRAWFDEDWKCLDYLDWLRWPEGFVCPHCASVVGWRLADSRWKCGGCDRKVSATAGTIFDKTRTPLTVWFATAWRMVGDKVGVSATQVQREMELGSYQTAWVMLHRYRSVMVRPGRDRLRGDVEVDESFPGGSEPGVPGRGALGKVLFAGAVELDESGFGRARLGVIPNASAVSLAAFLDANVEPGSRVITDGWSAYPAATRDRYEHTGTSVAASGLAAHEVLPAVHRVFSLVKRWLMGTMQGSVSPEHVQAYFDVPLQQAALTKPRPAVPHPPATSSRGPARHLPVVAQDRTDPTRRRNRHAEHGSYRPAWTWDDPNCLGVLEVLRREVMYGGIKMETPFQIISSDFPGGPGYNEPLP